MLLDIGVSSMQLDQSNRGFSFQVDGPLDMRMDPTRDRTAADIVNHWDEGDLADLIYYEGGETAARKIARAIVQGRRRAPFLRSAALVDTIVQAIGGAGGKLHPATRTFQALRRAVNEEGEELRSGLCAARHLLAAGGRLVVISFHSGEDREVKRFFADGARKGEWRILTHKPLEADLAERRANPRSRSARMRAAQRLAPAPESGPFPTEPRTGSRT
jgi:16S rRNA (cytosine1402-N4)-methyltransferase